MCGWLCEQVHALCLAGQDSSQPLEAADEQRPGQGTHRSQTPPPGEDKEEARMFKTIARLIFGGEEEQRATEDVRPKEEEEAEDEEWLVVSHDGGSQCFIFKLNALKLQMIRVLILQYNLKSEGNLRAEQVLLK